MKRFYIILTIFLLIGCKTINVEDNYKNEVAAESMDSEPNYSFTEKLETEIDDDEISDEEVYVSEIMKENDVASAIVYVEPPETIYCEPAKETPDLIGDEALKQYLKDMTILPQYADGRLKAWSYREGQIYQIHTQTYHSTLIQFEPGEKMLEVPYISEPDVWRLSRGVGIKNGLDTQYLIIKPDYSGLTSTLIVITNYRIYLMELKSYKDHYMPYVKWIYPMSVQEGQSWIEWQAKQENKAVLEFTGANIELCSFDYKITHPLKKPLWCPNLVYDDGKFTYIVLDRKALQTEMPTVFIDSRKLVNTQVHKNVIVINQLITKCTLRLGKTKVKITKKKTSNYSSVTSEQQTEPTPQNSLTN